MPPLFTGLWCGKSTPVCGGFPLSDTLARLEDNFPYIFFTFHCLESL
jgi:hypothetical protein